MYYAHIVFSFSLSYESGVPFIFFHFFIFSGLEVATPPLYDHDSAPSTRDHDLDLFPTSLFLIFPCPSPPDTMTCTRRHEPMIASSHGSFIFIFIFWAGTFFSMSIFFSWFVVYAFLDAAVPGRERSEDLLAWHVVEERRNNKR